MLDIKFIRENPELINKTALNKGMKFEVNELLDLDKKRRDLSSEVDGLRHELKEGNRLSRPCPKRKRVITSPK